MRWHKWIETNVIFTAESNEYTSYPIIFQWATKNNEVILKGAKIIHLSLDICIVDENVKSLQPIIMPYAVYTPYARLDDIIAARAHT